MKITSRAPTRIGLIGGGTDVNPFASDFGGKVLSFAINIYQHVFLEPLNEENIYIDSLGKKTVKKLDDKLIYGEEKEFDLLYAIINHFRPFIKTGFKLKNEFKGYNSGGLGASGSAAVATIGVFNKWLEKGLSQMQMAMLAWQTEVHELGWPGGKQDQLAAAFGGINLLTFGPKNAVKVTPLDFKPKLIKKIKAWTLLFYIGGQRHSGQLQKKLAQGMTEKEKIKALHGLKKGVDQVISGLNEEDFSKVGEILDKAWEFKKKSNPVIANSRVNDIYNLAKKQGVLGGKIMGAGSGGHMFFFCPPVKQAKLIKTLSKENVKLIKFNFDFQGLQVKVRK